MLTDSNQNEGLLAQSKQELPAGAGTAPDRTSVNSAPKVVVQESVITESRTQKKDQKKGTSRQCLVFLKIINIVVGLTYIAFAVFFYYDDGQKTDDPNQNRGFFVKWGMPGYIGLSGLIIVLIECRFKFMLKNLRFLYNYFGRGLFNIYAGGMPLMFINNWNDGLETNQILAITAAGVMVLVGFFYICLKVCCCMKEDYRIRKHKEQDSDSE